MRASDAFDPHSYKPVALAGAPGRSDNRAARPAAGRGPTGRIGYFSGAGWGICPIRGSGRMAYPESQTPGCACGAAHWSGHGYSPLAG